MASVGAPALRAVAVPLANLPLVTADVVAHAGSLDEVSPEAHRIGPFGDVLSVAREGAPASAMTVLRDTGLAVVPSVSNRVVGRRSADVVSTMIHDPAQLARHVQLLGDLVLEHGYQGIDVDYQGLGREDRAAFSRFVGRLADALHEGGHRLSVTVYAKAEERLDDRPTVAQDYGALAVADEVRLITWDYHDPTTPAGPLAPVDWIADVLVHAIERIPPEKLLLGVAAAGYDWTRHGGTPVSHAQALALADRYAKGGVEFDPLGEAPWFRYLDEHGTAHEVWFEDARSMALKRRAAAAIGVRGVFLWMTTSPDTGVWAELAATR